MNHLRSKQFIWIALIVLFFSCSPRQKVVWENYNPQELIEAAKAKMPVVIDFYADWCVTCHEIENYTYANPDIIEALNDFKRLKVDLTMQTDPEALKLAERFSVEGLPTIIFLNSKGEEVSSARIRGFIAPKEFLESVHIALQNDAQLKKI